MAQNPLLGRDLDEELWAGIADADFNYNPLLTRNPDPSPWFPSIIKPPSEHRSFRHSSGQNVYGYLTNMIPLQPKLPAVSPETLHETQRESLFNNVFSLPPGQPEPQWKIESRYPQRKKSQNGKTPANPLSGSKSPPSRPPYKPFLE